MRILALDVGDRRIGLAISDEMGWTAQALETLIRKDLKRDLLYLTELILSREVTEVVVGLPRHLDGHIGPQAQKVLTFVESLKTRMPVPVLMWDERLTSREAERTLIEAHVRRSKRKTVVDQMAAVLILQNYLDAHQVRLSGRQTASHPIGEV
ncbi:MAG TPA: Holliday junction resolvase RuvX [Nitrospiria bacterium]|jgi:putative Holliday junction resolvase|nr:Holliday junction resolvase RuvX [Nitrospiria bacterium]